MQPVNLNQNSCRKFFIFLLLGLLCSYPKYSYAKQNSPVDSLLLQLGTEISDNAKAEIMTQIARDYYYTNIPEAIHFAEQAKELFRKENNIQGIGKSTNIVGAGYYAQGNYNAAEIQFREALGIARETDDLVLEGKLLNNLGNIKLNTGQLEQAIDYFLEAGTIFVENENIKGAISVENSLSSIYRSTGSYLKAHVHLEKALSYANEIQNTRLLGTIYHNLGALLFDEGRNEEAFEAGMKSYAIRIEEGHLAGQVKSLINLGSIYRKKGSDFESDTCFKKALLLAEDYGFIEDQAYIQMHLGFSSLENQEFQHASGYLTKSMELAENMGDLELQLQLHDYLFYIDSTQGNFATALSHLQQYNTLKSKFDISDSENKLQELENLYHLAKEDNKLKENTIRKSKSLINCLIAGLIIIVLLTILLIQQVVLRSHKKIAELSQENLRSQMNPHFIFNILNSIHSFILNNDSKSSSNYLLKFSHLLRLTLDNSSSRLASVNDELEALKLYLELEAMRFNNQLEYEIIVDDEIDPLMFKIPPLLLQPYVENSVLHGLQNKKGKGKIEIRLDYENNGIHCSITDNGIGRKKAEDLKKENGIKRKSYGTRITETRLQLLNTIYGRKYSVRYTDLKDENENAKGTRVEFNLPVLN